MTLHGCDPISKVQVPRVRIQEQAQEQEMIER